MAKERAVLKDCGAAMAAEVPAASATARARRLTFMVGYRFVDCWNHGYWMGH
jgi:hypothetical protein